MECFLFFFFLSFLPPSLFLSSMFISNLTYDSFHATCLAACGDTGMRGCSCPTNRAETAGTPFRAVRATFHHSWKHRTFILPSWAIRFAQRVKWKKKKNKKHVLGVFSFFFYFTYVQPSIENTLGRLDQKKFWAAVNLPIPAHAFSSLLGVGGRGFFPVLPRKSHIPLCKVNPSGPQDNPSEEGCGLRHLWWLVTSAKPRPLIRVVDLL